MANASASAFPIHPWRISETAFTPAHLKHREALFALANGYMGERACHEFMEGNTDTLRGFYVAGVFDAYSTSTMVTLKGRPTHPHQMVNLPDALPVALVLDGEPLDLQTAEVKAYARTLHMDSGVLTLDMTVRTPASREIRVEVERFLSLRHRHVAAARYRLTPLSGDMNVELISTVNGEVKNLTASHLVEVRPAGNVGGVHGVLCRTSSSGIDVAVLAREVLGSDVKGQTRWASGVSEQRMLSACTRGQTITLEKLVAVATSRDIDARAEGEGRAELDGRKWLTEAVVLGFDALRAQQAEAWAEVWRTVEIDIAEQGGAAALTQGLHYSVFQMFQNAPNSDHTVNIGARGLTGEHYYGTYFWDTEAFMLPMFAFTQPQIARDLVKSRAYWLPGARRKAAEMGLRGAAFPWMSDANGDEACTLWQFTFLEIHVIADVAWSVWFMWCATGDLDLIADGGIDIMVETSRFWLSRAHLHEASGQYVINRVLGPDEYHQGVDNNYYTNILAQENLLKTVALLEILQQRRPQAHAASLERLHLDSAEIARFTEVGQRIRLPRDVKRGLNLQDDRFDYLEPWDLKKNPPGGALPGVWTYDRIMRTQALRQADVVLAHLLVGDRFTAEDMRRDFDFYEPLTTHDSSLSFCSYSIMAAKLRKREMALDYFLRTARLDLDDIHGNGWMGVHTACLAGAWQCVVFGFGGVRWYEGELSLDPLLPEGWDSFTFSLAWRGQRLHVKVLPEVLELRTDGGQVPVRVGGRTVTAGPVTSRVPCAARPSLGVIFDLDGVLVDTAEFHYQAWQKLADRIQVPFDRQRNEALRGVDRMNSLLLLLGEHAGRFSQAEKEAFCTEKNADYVKLIKSISPKDLLPGARQLLEALRDAGIPAAVASSSKNARPVIQRLGIADLLTAVVDGAEVSAAKPAPDLFLLAAEKMGLAPQYCVVVEDAEAGVQAALRGGMRCIGIGDASRVGAAQRVVPGVAQIGVPLLRAMTPKNPTPS